MKRKKSSPQAGGIATGAGQTEPALSTQQAAAYHKADLAPGQLGLETIGGQPAEVGPAASKVHVISTSVSTIAGAKPPFGHVRDELVQRLAPLLDWRLRDTAEWRLELTGSERYPDYTDADVQHEMARTILDRLERWTTMENVPPEPAPAPKRKPVPPDIAVSRTCPETQVGKAVRLLASNPNQWIAMPDIDDVSRSRNAHSMMSNLRRRFGWTINNKMETKKRGKTFVKPSYYMLVWPPPPQPDEGNDGGDAVPRPA